MNLRSLELAGGGTVPYGERWEPSGTAMVPLHGYGGSLHSLERVLPHLPEAIHAVAPTRREPGGASRLADGCTVRQFAGDVAEFADRLGLGPAMSVGASSGGLLGRGVAVDHPVRTLGVEHIDVRVRNIADERLG